MQNGTRLIQAFAFGAGATVLFFILLAFYFRIGAQFRSWIANVKMKSLFWRDQRRRKITRKMQ